MLSGATGLTGNVETLMNYESGTAGKLLAILTLHHKYPHRPSRDCSRFLTLI